MRSVTFNFRPDVPPEQQDEVLEHINAWDAVRRASRLKPDAQHPLLLRMAYATAADDADLEDLRARLSELPEIESASIPPQRRLVQAAAGKKSRASSR